MSVAVSKNIICESRADKLAISYLKGKGINSYEEQMRYIGSVKHDIPNLRLDKGKFVLGALRLHFEGGIRDAGDINALNKALKYIHVGGHVGEFDEDLNGLSISEIANMFSKEAESASAEDRERSQNRELSGDSLYQIVPINSFEEAEKYGKFTSWCVTHDESAFNNYTKDGSRFYFCLLPGFENCVESAGEGCPLDEYGLSMVSICVDSDGSPAYITTRWNHEHGGENNEKLCSAEQVEDVMNVRFYETFKPYSEEELKKMGKWVDPVVGQAVRYNNRAGWIYYADSEAGKYYVISRSANMVDNWDDVDWVCARLPEGWRLPKKDELEPMVNHYEWFCRKTGIFDDAFRNGDYDYIVTDSPTSASGEKGVWCLSIQSGEWYRYAFRNISADYSVLIPIAVIETNDIKQFFVKDESVSVDLKGLRGIIGEAVEKSLSFLNESDGRTCELYHGGDKSDDPFYSGVLWLADDDWYAAQYCEGKKNPCIWKVTVDYDKFNPVSICEELGDEFDPYDPDEESIRYIRENGYNGYMFPLNDTDCTVLTDKSCIVNMEMMSDEEVARLMEEEGVS